MNAMDHEALTQEDLKQTVLRQISAKRLKVTDAGDQSENTNEHCVVVSFVACKEYLSNADGQRQVGLSSGSVCRSSTRDHVSATMMTIRETPVGK